MRFLLPCLIALAACSGNSGPAPVTPSEIASLEKERARFPDDPEVLNRIGIRYYEGKRWDQALETLRASFQHQRTFTSAVYLGLTHEATGRFVDAEAYYRAAAALTLTPTQRRELDRRLADLGEAGDRPRIDPYHNRTGAGHDRGHALDLHRV